MIELLVLNKLNFKCYAFHVTLRRSVSPPTHLNEITIQSAGIKRHSGLLIAKRLIGIRIFGCNDKI